MCICPILQLHTCSEAVKPSDRQNASLAREQSIRSCSTSTEPSAELSVFILKQIYREKKKYFLWWYCFSAQVVFWAQKYLFLCLGYCFQLNDTEKLLVSILFFFISSNECWRESFIFIKKSLKYKSTISKQPSLRIPSPTGNLLQKKNLLRHSMTAAK